LLHGFRILLTGEPNAGKSSLLNLLCGRQRAIVSETPGTTRDLLEAETCLAGWVLQFHDSAGIRSATDSEIEADGIRRSLSAANTVDLICCVAGLQPVPTVLLQALAQARCPVLLVQNKADLLTDDEQVKMSSQPVVAPFAASVVVSALTGAGLSELHQQMLHLLIPEQPAADEPLPLEQALSQVAGG
jgi:tRNA modification GTPase